MADVEKNYLDLQGLQTYDNLIKDYVDSSTSLPTYDAEHTTLVFGSSNNQNSDPQNGD